MLNLLTNMITHTSQNSVQKWCVYAGQIWITSETMIYANTKLRMTPNRSKPMIAAMICPTLMLLPPLLACPNSFNYFLHFRVAEVGFVRHFVANLPRSRRQLESRRIR